jgi:hypothetical protein
MLLFLVLLEVILIIIHVVSVAYFLEIWVRTRLSMYHSFILV